MRLVRNLVPDGIMHPFSAASSPWSNRASGARTAALLLGLVGCSAKDLPGEYFDITVESTSDECNDPKVVDKETFTYRLVVEGSAVTLFMDDSLLATGSLQGCDLTYQSPIWTDNRDDGNGGTTQAIGWSIHGDATVGLSDLCDAGDGWVGEERIDVLNSTDPDVPAGCSYFLDATGTYTGSVE